MSSPSRGHETLDAEALQAQAEEEQHRIREQFFQPKTGGESIATLRNELTSTMESGVGIYREESSLRATCDKLAELKERYERVELIDYSLTFNTELTTALELGSLLDCAEAVAHSALGRTESRGSHQRTDHVDRDDERFLKHSLAYRTEGDPRLDYQDVVITKWPPGERVYGKS